MINYRYLLIFLTVITVIITYLVMGFYLYLGPYSNRVEIINDSNFELSDVIITIGKKKIFTSNIKPGESRIIWDSPHREGYIAFEAVYEGSNLSCGVGYTDLNLRTESVFTISNKTNSLLNISVNYGSMEDHCRDQ